MQNSTRFIREKKERDYSVISNIFLRDNRLSAQAMGIFAYILSLPDDWQLYMTELPNHFKNGKDSIRSAIKELEEYGYIVMEKAPSEKGRFSGYNYRIVENPREEIEGPHDEHPLTEPSPEPQETVLTAEEEEMAKTFELEVEGSKKSKPRKPKENSESFKKAEYNEAFEAYEQACTDLHSQNRIPFEKPVIDFRICQVQLKKNFVKYGVKETINAIKLAKMDGWIVSNGFLLNMILSAKIINRLINGVVSQAVKPKGSAMSQVTGLNYQTSW